MSDTERDVEVTNRAGIGFIPFSSHLKPFKKSRKTQRGINLGDQKLPYGRKTLLFGHLNKTETEFSANRTFIKIEGHGIYGKGVSMGETMGHLQNWAAKSDGTREDLRLNRTDFREKTGAIVEGLSGVFSAITNEKLRKDLKSAAKKGLTALANFIKKHHHEKEYGLSSETGKKIREAIDEALKDQILKGYQQEATKAWIADEPQTARTALSYFETHDQSGRRW
jgi:hypothetical protein